MNEAMLVNILADIIIKSVVAMQEVSRKSREEVLAAIPRESDRTDELLKLLE